MQQTPIRTFSQRRAHLHTYCSEQDADLTRSCAYRKNDNGFVEQKNNDVVRKHVGCARYETAEQVGLLNELYERLRLLINFFYPSAKLLERTRHGPRIYRRYDAPRAPYQRVLACQEIPDQSRQILRRQFESLNLPALQCDVVRLQRQLLRVVAQAKSPPARQAVGAQIMRVSGATPPCCVAPRPSSTVFLRSLTPQSPRSIGRRPHTPTGPKRPSPRPSTLSPPPLL